MSGFNQIILAWQKVFMRLKRQMYLMFIKTLKIEKYNANILIFVQKLVIKGWTIYQEKTINSPYISPYKIIDIGIENTNICHEIQLTNTNTKG